MGRDNEREGERDEGNVGWWGWWRDLERERGKDGRTKEREEANRGENRERWGKIRRGVRSGGRESGRHKERNRMGKYRERKTGIIRREREGKWVTVGTGGELGRKKGVRNKETDWER